MLRPSASRITLLGAEDDLSLLVVAHLEAWGVAVRRADATTRDDPPADALVVVLGAADGDGDGHGERPAVGRAAEAIVAAGASGVPVVAVVLEPATSEALDAALTASPSELLIGVPSGRDLFEALESAVTSSAADVAARPGVPALDATREAGADEAAEAGSDATVD